MIRCDDCGAENSPGVTFCTSCGRYLGWDEDSPPTQAEPTKPAVPESPGEQTQFTPMGKLGGVVSSQAWFLCRPKG